MADYLLTSSSIHKTTAFENTFPGTKYDTINVSGTPNQPYGRFGTLVCALKRIEEAEKMSELYRYIVSIENGIFTKSYIDYDFAVAVIKDTKDNSYLTSIFDTNEIKVVVPKKYTTTLKLSKQSNVVLNKINHEKIGYDVTAGSIISKEFGCSSSNWMTEYGIDRETQLCQALTFVRKLELSTIKNNFEYIDDFPTKGVRFCNIFPIFDDPIMFNNLIDHIVSRIYVKSIVEDVVYDRVFGPEARGFLLGPQVAMKLGCRFIPIRKKGKLPGKPFSVDYKKEYGVDTFEMADMIPIDGNGIVIDDILATGGSSGACAKLARLSGCAQILGVFVADVSSLRKEAIENLQGVDIMVLT